MASQNYMQSTSMPAKLRTGLHKLGDVINNFLVEYWAHIITIVLGSLVFIALAIPFLSYFGLDSIAKPLFFTLHLVCAQIPSHSFYILGHQVGLCARNFSIYTAMFLGSLIFLLSKKRVPGNPLVDLDLDAITHCCRWSHTTGRMAREYLGTTHHHWFTLWARKCLVRPPDDAPKPTGDCVEATTGYLL